MTYTDEAVEKMLDAFSPQFDWRKSKLPSADECRRSMRAALSAADAAMEAAGWVRVPVEPTEAMMKAASETKAMQAVDSCLAIAAIHGCGLHQADSSADVPLAHAYRAMIAARPTTEKEG